MAESPRAGNAMIVEGLVVPLIEEGQLFTTPISGYYLFFGSPPPAVVVEKGEEIGSSTSATIETPPVVVNIITHSVDGADGIPAATDRLGAPR